MLRCVRCTHELATDVGAIPESCAWCGLPTRFSLPWSAASEPAAYADASTHRARALPAFTLEEWVVLYDTARRYQQAPMTLTPAEWALMRVLRWAYETGRLVA